MKKDKLVKREKEVKKGLKTQNKLRVLKGNKPFFHNKTAIRGAIKMEKMKELEARNMLESFVKKKEGRDKRKENRFIKQIAHNQANRSENKKQKLI